MPFHFQKLPEVFRKKNVLKNFANFTGKHLCWSLFFIKFNAFRPAILCISYDLHKYVTQFRKIAKGPVQNLSTTWKDSI